MNSSCLYAGPRTRLLQYFILFFEVNHCYERMESSVLPLEFNGNTIAVDASASEVSIHECFRTTSMFEKQAKVDAILINFCIIP
ncbi:hypothetical protein AAG906_026038 [Vitis piasezkii]